MKKEKNMLENGLIIPEKENVFSRFFKWIKGIFGKDEIEDCSDNTFEEIENIDITIPKSVKISEKIITMDTEDTNSLEYLYKLSDQELDDLDNSYDSQMEKSKNEIKKLNGIIKSYRESIKKVQGNIEV